ncbi:MAG: D-sedoheptulose 7-phosphate isomerase [Desulfobacterales bacterium]
MTDPARIITDILEESLTVKRASVLSNRERLQRGAEMLAACLSAGRKVLIFGNGGSAADSQHMAAEFVNRFRLERPPLAAIALTTDSSILTAIGNDHRFEEVFTKQINALGAAGDLAWGISTSGNSPNVVEAVRAAGRRGLATIGMTGRGGGLAAAADLVLTVDSDVTARIQETHITMGHILCELVERILFPEGFAHEA